MILSFRLVWCSLSAIERAFRWISSIAPTVCCFACTRASSAATLSTGSIVIEKYFRGLAQICVYVSVYIKWMHTNLLKGFIPILLKWLWWRLRSPQTFHKFIWNLIEYTDVPKQPNRNFELAMIESIFCTQIISEVFTVNFEWNITYSENAYSRNIKTY